MPPLPPDLIDLALAGRGAMGQDPLVALPDAAGRVETVAISRPYGRLGNNLYQLLNAALVARGLGLRRVLVPEGMVCRGRMDATAVAELTVAPFAGAEATGCLHGSHFVPFGCEAAVLRVDDAAAEALARGLCDALLGDVLATAAEATEPTIAVAFRGGDVFGLGAPAAYVQPPAAYYLRAIAHARAAAPNCPVDLVCADRANPALPIVEDALAAAGVRFRSREADARSDLARLCAAQALVSCPSTFVDAAALTSRRLRTLYSFREHAFQSEFRPFMQWRLPAVLRHRGVAGVLIDDASRTYANKWQWDASPAQLDAIRDYDAGNLRLYSGF